MSTQIPENRARFSLSEILAATGGRVLGAPGSVVEIEGVSTDSRSILAGKCFVALRGEHFDAHRFLRKAADSGARVLVVEEQAELEELLEGQGLGSGGSSPPGGPALVVVGDTLIALGALARRHRERWGGKLATVAGSAGKTTTRSVTSALLSAMHPGEVHSTVGNLNNRIGVPMVLLGLCSEHSYAVVEIGTNCPGEVKALTELAQPNLAVLTLIDLEHTEGLGDLDGVEREERQAFSALGGRGIAVGFGEDERVLRSVLNAPAGRRATYGFEVGRDLRIVSRELLGTQGERVLLKRKDGSELSIETPLPGRPNVLALAAGLTVVELLSDVRLEPRRIEAALSGAGERGRSTIVELPGGVVVVDDTYNASPASVAACIETGRELSRISGGRLWLVLGEMLELGALSVHAHEEMGRLAGASGATGVAFIQGEAKRAFSMIGAGLEWSAFFSAAEEVAAHLAPRVRPRDVIVVKASRGVRAERVVEGLAELLVPARGQSHFSENSPQENGGPRT